MVMPCPACGMEMAQAHINAHMAHECRAVRSRCGAASNCKAGRGCGAPGGSTLAPRSGAGATSRPLAFQLPGTDGRVPCAVCGRKFAPDRIAKHQYVCAGLKRGPARRPGCGSQPTLGARPLPPPTQSRTPKAPTVSRPQPRKGANVHRHCSDSTRAHAAPSWRQQSNDLRAAMRAAKAASAAAPGPQRKQPSAPANERRSAGAGTRASAPSSRSGLAQHAVRIRTSSSCSRGPVVGGAAFGGGGGISNSNLTSADNPFAAQCRRTYR